MKQIINKIRKSINIKVKKRAFNKYVVIAISLVLIVTGAIKIHSTFSFSKTHDWNYHQIQKIEQNQTNFSFDVFADNKNSITTFNHLIDRVNNDDSVFAIGVGDLVFTGDENYYSFFLNQAKHMDKPLLTVVGNHEIYDGGRDNYYDTFGPFYYSFTVGNSYFIILDDANEKNIDPWQMDWLNGELQKSQNYTFRFVFMHVPLYDPRTEEQPGHSMKNLTFANELNRIFDEYNTTMIFCSHIHSYYNGTWGTTPYTITGGAGAELDTADSNHDFYHYIRVEVSDDGIKYHVMPLKSPEFELWDRTVHNVWLYTYAFIEIHSVNLIIYASLFYLGYYIVIVKKKWLILNFKSKKP